MEKTVVPFLNKKRVALKLNKIHPALAIFDCFRKQTTPELFSLFEKCNIIKFHQTDKLQPLGISVNKPIKAYLKRSFHSWYIDEVQKQLNLDLLDTCDCLLREVQKGMLTV